MLVGNPTVQVVEDCSLPVDRRFAFEAATTVRLEGSILLLQSGVSAPERMPLQPIKGEGRDGLRRLIEKFRQPIDEVVYLFGDEVSFVLINPDRHFDLIVAWILELPPRNRTLQLANCLYSEGESIFKPL